jgi:aarF domain-containing kinase
LNYIKKVSVYFQIAAISEQASKSSGEPPNSEQNSSNPLGWKSFDMRAVVNATEDILQFILSEKGVRVRVFLLRDIIGAADVFVRDEVVGCSPSEKLEAIETSEFEVCLNSSCLFISQLSDECLNTFS